MLIPTAMLFSGGADREVLVIVLQSVAGIVLGIGAIGAVFWFTFRRPPPRRRLDNTTSAHSSVDAETIVRAFNDGQTHAGSPHD